MQCFVFIIWRHYTTLKMVKSIKIEQTLLKMVKAMTPKANGQNILFLNGRIPFSLYCRCNECGIKLLILVNNYLWIHLVSTRHQTPWYAKHKLFCGRFQSENWTEHVSTGHSNALVQHRKMHRKVQNVATITPLQKDHTLLTLLFDLSK